MMMEKDRHDLPLPEDRAENNSGAESNDTRDDIQKEQIPSGISAKAEKEARKMRLRKVLYPIAIIAIILLWLSSLLEQ